MMQPWLADNASGSGAGLGNDDADSFTISH